MFDNPNRIRHDITLQDLAEVAIEAENRANQRFQQMRQDYDALRTQMSKLVAAFGSREACSY